MNYRDDEGNELLLVPRLPGLDIMFEVREAGTGRHVKVTLNPTDIAHVASFLRDHVAFVEGRRPNSR